MAHGYPDFEGDKSGLYLTPEWAAKEGTDKDFYIGALNKATTESIHVSYAVPAGKKLYISHLAGRCTAYLAEDRDNNQAMAIEIYDDTTDTIHFHQGGNCGTTANLLKPIVIEAEHTVFFTVFNYANHNCNLAISAGGYEI